MNSKMNAAKTRAEEIISSVQGNAHKVWEKVRQGAPLPTGSFSTYKSKVEQAATDGWQRVIENLPVASKAQVSALQRDIEKLTNKINELTAKIEPKN